MQVARIVSQTIKSLNSDGSVKSIGPITNALTSYAELITPWASTVAEYMLADVSRRNEKAWLEHGNELGMELRNHLKQTSIGAAYRQLLAEQINLIKSIPLEAAEKVHGMVQEGLFTSTRSTVMAKRILEIADVPLWRAKLIARTEVSRSACTLTQVRAENLGSQGYIWRTSKDGDVRPEHQKMEGVYVPWSKPPKTDKSLAPYHAGCGPNCRCWPDPILPEF